MKISLREYLEARNSLVQAYMANPTVSEMYRVKKYIKMPMIMDGKRITVSLRPNDVVETVALPKDGINTIVKMRFVCSHNISIVDDKMRPVWKNKKLLQWLKHNCERTTLADENEDLGGTL